jgi:predicted MFS family arabinose efflux permease
MTITTQRLAWYYTPAAVIIAGCLIAIVNFGVRSSFGLFTGPVSETYGWPRETYSFAMAIQNLLWGIAAIPSGALADRYGAMRVLMAGAVIYCVGTLLMVATDNVALFTFGGGILAGTGIALSSFSIVMAAFGRLVPPDKRSWTFGIATASGSLGQFIFAPLGSVLISAYGWPAALAVLAVSTLSIVLFALPLRAESNAGFRRPPGETSLAMGQAIATAFGNRSFLLLTAGFFVCGFHLAFITVHLPPYLAEHGISKEVAGFAMGAIGLFNVIGAYSSGIIGGKYKKPLPLCLIYLARSLTIAAFVLLPVTPFTTFAFTASIGLLWLSTVPLTMGLVVSFFGTRYMATLYGFVFLSHQVGGFLGVWLGGKLYDRFGSYDPVWWGGIALGLFAALVHLPIREQRDVRFATG